VGELADADVIVDADELERALTVADPAAESDITSRRNVEILREYASRTPHGHPKRIVLRFLLSPAAYLPDDRGHLGAVELVRNELVPTPDGGLRAQPTAERETITAGLAFRAIGYRGIPLPGVPFDARSAVIPNEAGRVLDAESKAQLPGEYVVGWIKRGPSGVIGTNKKDAQETVDAMLADLAALTSSNGQTPAPGQGSVHLPASPDEAAVEALLRSRQPELVTYSGWEAIDTHERALGEPAGRPRVKLTSVEELLRVAAAEEP
jgi:ferredoxin--NADP+ reductase